MTDVQVVYRDTDEHQEWKRVQAGLLAARNKRIEILESALRNVKQELAIGRVDLAAETCRRALFPSKEEVRGWFPG